MRSIDGVFGEHKHGGAELLFFIGISVMTTNELHELKACSL